MECIKLLLTNGADATIKNENNETAADKVQLDDNNRATILYLIEETIKSNIIYCSRHVSTILVLLVCNYIRYMCVRVCNIYVYIYMLIVVTIISILCSYCLLTLSNSPFIHNQHM